MRTWLARARERPSSPWRSGWRHVTSPTPPPPPSRSTFAVTRLANQADPVPDSIWDEAAGHYDEQAAGALILAIATISFWNDLNATKQVGGSWQWNARIERLRDAQIENRVKEVYRYAHAMRNEV